MLAALSESVSRFSVKALSFILSLAAIVFLLRPNVE
jgi:hypothetical protein